MLKIIKKIILFACIMVFLGICGCQSGRNNASSSLSEQGLSSSSKASSVTSSANNSSCSSSSNSSENASIDNSSSISSETSSANSSMSSNNSNSGTDEPEEVVMTNETISYAEMWRPKYHYSAEQSWVNDPNGLVYYKGVWHKYYQTNPNVNKFGNIHWGHATSTDLINWVEHEPILAPDSVGLMFSGTAVVDHNNSTGFFTNTADKKGIVLAYSTDTQHIGIAYSLDDGYTFTKVSETTPVLQNPNEEHFRDPHIFWHEETNEWIMVIAGGWVRYYASSDLLHWEHRSTSNIWTECPNLVKFKVEGTTEYKWLLYCGGRGYYVGSFNGTTFTPETDYIKIDGPDNYAGITYANAPNDRIVMSSWLNSWDYTAPEGKWNGCFTLPIEMKLVKTSNSYRLIQNPVEEVSKIKGDTLFSATNQTYTNTNALQGVKSNSFELNAEIDVNNSSSFTLSFCLGDGDATKLTYNKSTSEIVFDRTQSKYGFDALKNKGVHSFKVDSSTNANGIMKLRLFVDVDNIELYVNDGYYYFIGRIQPFSSSQSMSLIGESVVVKSLTVNSCKSLFVQEDATAIHYGDNSTVFALIGGEDITRDFYVLGSETPILSVGDSTKISASIVDGKIKIKALSSGITWVRITAGKYYKDLEVLAYNQGESYFNSQLGDLTISGGTMSISPLDMKIVSGGGDAVAFSNITCKDVEYSADIRLEDSGAGALLIRAKDSNSFYSINIDRNSNIVKFWKKVNGQVSDIASKSIVINAGEFYNLKVVAKGASIKVYLNDNLVLEAEDYSLTEGKLGLNVFQSEGRFNNIVYTPIIATESNIDVLGQVTNTNAKISIDNNIINFDNVGGGDALSVGSVTASNFEMSADIAVGGIGAGAVLLRYVDSNNFYCVNIDSEYSVVKFWKKVNGAGVVIAQELATITQGTFYNLKVELNGISVKIYLNNSLIIDATDGDFTSGNVGLNTWQVDCYFKNISITQKGGYAYLGNVTTQNSTLSQNANVFTFDNTANSGDAFVIGDVVASNFTISGDITLSSIGAGSFIVRYLDSNNFYCINIDSEYNVVKLWKKVNGASGEIISQHFTTINSNTTYNLKVQLNGQNIKVYLNNTEVINVTDSAFSQGKIGFNSWITDFTIKDIKYTV